MKNQIPKPTVKPIEEMRKLDTPLVCQVSVNKQHDKNDLRNHIQTKVLLSK